ncbi:MAG: PaaI family thioesterase [Burkholderiales bacterium]
MAAGDWAAEMTAAMAHFTGPGVSPLETLRANAGLDFLRGIVAGRFPQAPITTTLGFFLIEVERGRAVFQGTPRPEHGNPIGSIHAGWAATLLDSCMACAVHSTLPAGQGYTTVEFKLNLVRPVRADSGPLRAEGKLVSAGRTIGTSEGRLVGPDGKLYAHGTETCLIFPL